MPPPTTRPAEAVHVNGPALRAIRQALGVKVSDVVAAMQCDPSTISKLETGANLKCSPSFLHRLAAVLGIEDRRALLACPYGAEQHHDHIAEDPAATAPMPRPAPGGVPFDVTADRGAPRAGVVVPEQRGRGRHRKEAAR